MVFLIRLGIVWGFPSEETLDGLYCLDCIVWIVSAGLYWLDHIGWIILVLVLGLLGETGFYELAGFLLAVWDGWTGLDISGTGVGWRDRRYQA